MPRHRRTESKSSAILSKVKLSVFFYCRCCCCCCSHLLLFSFRRFLSRHRFPNTNIYFHLFFISILVFSLSLGVFFFAVWEIPYHSCPNKFPFVVLPFDFYLETCYRNISSHNTIQWPPWTKTAHKTIDYCFFCFFIFKRNSMMICGV